jgi:hypothetical protein
MPRKTDRMHNMSKPSFLLGVMGVLVFTAGVPCSAQIPVVSSAVDHATDHAFDRFNEAVENTRRAAYSVTNVVDDRLKARIDQINDIVSRTMEQIHDERGRIRQDTEQILDKATKNVTDLEAQFMSDVLKAIKDAECAGTRTFQQALVEALGRIGHEFGTNEIEIAVPPLYDGERPGLFCQDDFCRMKKTVQITRNYSAAYREVAKYLTDRLDHAREDTPRTTVVDTYSVIASLARSATCFMPGEEPYYANQYVKYVSKVRAWDVIP